MDKTTGKLSLIIGVFLLAGCKLEWSSQILLSKLFDKSVTIVSSDLVAEVAACNSYEDSRKPSDSLLRVQGAILDVFPDAKFEECYTQQMNSFAKFTLPIAYGAAELLKPEHPKLRVLSYDNRAVFVNLSPSIEDKVRGYQTNKLSVTDFNPSDVSIIIKIKNDTGEDQKVEIQGAYVDNYPVVHAVDFNFLKDKSLSFRLSNVTAETMFLPSKQNQYAVFMIKSESK